MRRSVAATALVATSLSLVIVQDASAHKAHVTKQEHRYLHARFAVRDKFGQRAVGRNIVFRGYRDHGGVRAPRHSELARSTRLLERWLSPPIVAPPLTVHASSQTPTPGPVTYAGYPLSAIRQCESGGNYSTDTGNGFYGAYQFTLSTWQSVGGSGNPASASPEEQDRRAAMLYSREGPGPWPVCGR